MRTNHLGHILAVFTVLFITSNEVHEVVSGEERQGHCHWGHHADHIQATKRMENPHASIRRHAHIH